MEAANENGVMFVVLDTKIHATFCLKIVYCFAVLEPVTTPHITLAIRCFAILEPVTIHSPFNQLAALLFLEPITNSPLH